LSLDKILEHEFFRTQSLYNKENRLAALGVTSNSLKSQQEPDPYFVSNVGLKPVKHRTRHGWLEITSNGDVFMDLISENRVYYITHQGERVRSKLCSSWAGDIESLN
jgi:hypothetical protein